MEKEESFQEMVLRHFGRSHAKNVRLNDMSDLVHELAREVSLTYT